MGDRPRTPPVLQRDAIWQTHLVGNAHPVQATVGGNIVDGQALLVFRMNLDVISRGEAGEDERDSA